MKKLFYGVLLLFVFSIYTVATPAKRAAGEKTYSGILMDKACATKEHTAGGKQVAAFTDAKKVAEHTSECAQMPPCVASGYGIVTDGKFLKFDKKGDELAEKWLDKSKTEKNLKITVTGQEENGELKVTRLK